MKAENRIFQRGVKKKKVETTGEEGHFHLASGQSASEPRSMIGNLQKSLGGFGSPPPSSASDLRRYVTVQMRGHQMDLRSA